MFLRRSYTFIVHLFTCSEDVFLSHRNDRYDQSYLFIYLFIHSFIHSLITNADLDLTTNNTNPELTIICFSQWRMEAIFHELPKLFSLILVSQSNQVCAIARL